MVVFRRTDRARLKSTASDNSRFLVADIVDDMHRTAGIQSGFLPDELRGCVSDTILIVDRHTLALVFCRTAFFMGHFFHLYTIWIRGWANHPQHKFAQNAVYRSSFARHKQCPRTKQRNSCMRPISDKRDACRRTS